MSKSGQNNQKGIFAQNWAALSLFLQFLKDKNFAYIQLEPNDSEDFNLVFGDGKKIICESKYKLGQFTYSQLKEVLEKIVERGSVEGRDEILIVCRSVGQELISSTKNIRFSAFNKNLKVKLKKKGFSEELFDLMPRVNFWPLGQIEDSDINYSLVADLLNLWVPAEEIQRFTNDILQKNIFKKATAGSVYSREDFNKDLNDFRKEVQDRSDFFNLKKSKEEQFTKLEGDVKESKGIEWGTGSVSAFSARWDLMSFAMDRLKTRTDLNLKKWDDLWQLNRVYYFAFGIFSVFENNIVNDENRRYIVEYVKKYIKNIRGFYRSDFFDINIVKILTKIIDSNGGEKYLSDVFSIISDLIIFNEKEFFYLKDNGYDSDKWQKEEICKLLHKIYTRSNNVLKKKILKLLSVGFNITEDDGEFNHHAPMEVYNIFREWLDEDFKNRMPILIKLISEQYERFYKKFGYRVGFDGWEHSGGGISYHGNYQGSSYRISERYFVSFILSPAIRKFYDGDREFGWKFIKEKLVSREKQVSTKRPDFLNRAVYEIVLSRYLSDNDNESQEAFLILKEFILSRKGIPHKTDLIYQAISGEGVEGDKKWQLVKITVEKYGIPVNPFAEKIIADLAKKGFGSAKDILRQWFSDPKYYKQTLFSLDSVGTIRSFVEDNLDLALELFTILISNEYLKREKSDKFSAFTLAVLLRDILNKDYAKGLSVIRFLESEDVLSDDQQIVYSFSLFNHHGNDDSDDPTLLFRTYEEVVDPFLKNHRNDINKIGQRLTLPTAREAFLQFASRLAAKKKIKEALRIVEVFITDPDPYLPGQDPRDPKNEYNEHKKIENGDECSTIASVRGYCGWVLMKCSVLNGRDYVPKVIDLTKKLISDPNYYVVQMACFALAQILRNRLTVLPSNRDTLFFNDDSKTALQMAKEVESISFNLLDRLVSWPPLVQKAMSKGVFQAIEPLRALNENDSLQLVNNLAKLPVDSIEESAVLFIYFAEFRKNNYKKWKFGLPGLYDDLDSEKYDDGKFKSILIKTIEKNQQEDPDKCFPFVSAVEHTMAEAISPEDTKKNTELVFKYFNLLSNVYAHNIFNLIYRDIESNLRTPDEYTGRWFELLIKCLKVEKRFYEEQIEKKNTAEVYWYPSLYHSEILGLVIEKLGEDKFMQAAEIFFSFPKEIDLHENDGLVDAVHKISKNNKVAKGIIKLLIDKNPSKYWDLK